VQLAHNRGHLNLLVQTTDYQGLRKTKIQLPHPPFSNPFDKDDKSSIVEAKLAAASGSHTQDIAKCASAALVTVN